MTDSTPHKMMLGNIRNSTPYIQPEPFNMPLPSPTLSEVREETQEKENLGENIANEVFYTVMEKLGEVMGTPQNNTQNKNKNIDIDIQNANVPTPTTRSHLNNIENILRPKETTSMSNDNTLHDHDQQFYDSIDGRVDETPVVTDSDHENNNNNDVDISTTKNQDIKINQEDQSAHVKDNGIGTGLQDANGDIDHHTIPDNPISEKVRGRILEADTKISKNSEIKIPAQEPNNLNTHNPYMGEANILSQENDDNDISTANNATMNNLNMMEMTKMQEMLTNLQLQIDSLATQRLSPTSTSAYNTMETPIQQTHQCMPTSGYKGMIQSNDNPTLKVRACSSTLLRQVRILNQIYEDYDRACSNETILTRQESKIIKNIAKLESESPARELAFGQATSTKTMPADLRHCGLHAQPFKCTSNLLPKNQLTTSNERAYLHNISMVNEKLEHVQSRLETLRNFRRSIDTRLKRFIETDLKIHTTDKITLLSKCDLKVRIPTGIGSSPKLSQSHKFRQDLTGLFSQCAQQLVTVIPLYYELTGLNDDSSDPGIETPSTRWVPPDINSKAYKDNSNTKYFDATFRAQNRELFVFLERTAYSNVHAYFGLRSAGSSSNSKVLCEGRVNDGLSIIASAIIFHESHTWFDVQALKTKIANSHGLFGQRDVTYAVKQMRYLLEQAHKMQVKVDYNVVSMLSATLISKHSMYAAYLTKYIDPPADMVDTTDVLRNGILNSFLCEIEATNTRIRLSRGENSKCVRPPFSRSYSCVVM